MCSCSCMSVARLRREAPQPRFSSAWLQLIFCIHSCRLSSPCRQPNTISLYAQVRIIHIQATKQPRNCPILVPTKKDTEENHGAEQWGSYQQQRGQCRLATPRPEAVHLHLPRMVCCSKSDGSHSIWFLISEDLRSQNRHFKGRDNGNVESEAMSPPVTGAGAARESDDAGLGEPLLANGNGCTGGAMSPPVTGAGAARESDAAGLGEPLLANGARNGGTGGVHAGALTAAAVANGHGGDEPGAKNKGAVNAKDRHWVDVARPESEAEADLESGGGRPLLFRNRKVKNALLYPYRALIVTRLIAVILLILWRIKHNNSDAIWFWATSIVGDVWFGLSWLLYQVPKFNPIKRIPDLAALSQHCDLPDGSSTLPGIDVVVTTANPTDEPILYTMNCVLSILAADYPVDRYTCYLSDDSGELVLYEALVEAAKFATLWVPFCRKHCTEPRAPESYFETEGLMYTGRSREEFMSDYKRVRAEYEEFKARLDTLSNTIRQRSDVYNSMETKGGDDAKATWMANGTQWPGTWIDPTENHRKGNHAGIVQIVQDHPNRKKAQPGLQLSCGSPLNFADVDVRLPMLVYVAREKSACCHHNKKAGALNAQLRISALLSNAQFVVNFDCDHYINNSKALRAAMCFMLDRREGDSTAFVQFPQRFDNVDPADRYGNHNRVFFDGAMYGLNGLQGPTYLGTGCMFRRLALYGFDPPCWRPDEIVVDSDKFGNSIAFLNSALAAMKQERRLTPPPLDESFIAEMTAVVSASYDEGTGWGRGVGYIYRIATEDIVTGFRIHGQGWRSMYCAIEPDAFRGTAPINLTERLHQIVRWSGGSLEMFFSHNNPLLAGHRLSLMQRLSYVNFNVYPITSVFILIYALCPLMWLLPEEIFIQRPFTRYVLYLTIVILMIHTIGMFEIEWAGITWLDWWRNEQFFVIGSTSAYPTAVLHMTVKLLTNKGIYFRVTSKQTAADTDDRFADLYEMRWVPMLIPSAMVLFSNIMAIGVAIGKAILYMGTWSAAHRRRAALGMLFNLWIMALLHPFALAVIGRWGKRPSILFVLLPIAFVVIGLMYIGIHHFLIHFLPFMVI